MSPWAWIGGIVILVIGLIVVAGINNIGPLQTLFPQPTPTAFAPATEGQSLIIVADFEDRSGGKYQGIDPAQYIYEQLTAQAKKDNLDVRIERLRHTVDDNTVRPTGETYNATLVLWGWYDALPLHLALNESKHEPTISQPKKVNILASQIQQKWNLALSPICPVSPLIWCSLYWVSTLIDDPCKNYDKALRYFNSAIESLPQRNSDHQPNPTESYLPWNCLLLQRRLRPRHCRL